MKLINKHRLAFYETQVAPEKKLIVIFCHGFRSSSIGPNRFFIRAALQLAKRGIASVRFDQYGSGNSEGDFMNSSFNDWVDTTVAICEVYLNKGYGVALFGQSMGGATVIAAGSKLPNIAAVVSWVPDPSIDTFESSDLGFHEECGERVSERFWEEAHAAKIPEALSALQPPAYIVQCGDDEYVSEENHQSITKHAQSNHVVEMFPSYPHSSWTYDQATMIIDKSVSFLASNLEASRQHIRLTPHFKKAVEVIQGLQQLGVDPILYGSTGVSYYLGAFKPSFGDIDFLVPDSWLEKNWSKLQDIMMKLGYALINEHEHEFTHPKQPSVAFAKESILLRDKIVKSLNEILPIRIQNTNVRTLTPSTFRKAYEFSIKDGYRIEQRSKDDASIIKLLKGLC